MTWQRLGCLDPINILSGDASTDPVSANPSTQPQPQSFEYLDHIDPYDSLRSSIDFNQIPSSTEFAHLPVTSAPEHTPVYGESSLQPQNALEELQGSRAELLQQASQTAPASFTESTILQASYKSSMDFSQVQLSSEFVHPLNTSAQHASSFAPTPTNTVQHSGVQYHTHHAPAGSFGSAYAFPSQVRHCDFVFEASEEASLPGSMPPGGPHVDGHAILLLPSILIWMRNIHV